MGKTSIRQSDMERPHLDWVDVTRFLAIFFVVCVHCCDPFNCSVEARTNTQFQWWGSLYGAFLRPCVPLFAMMTGLLILPIRKGMSPGAFYRRRVLRVLVPFLIWSVLYCLFPWIMGLLGGTAETLVMCFPYSGYSGTPSLALGDALKNVFLIPVNFSVYDVHMWYIYMLIGLYLFMPVLSKWIESATKRDLQTYLLLWNITLFFPYVYYYVEKYFWGVCSWNSFNTLYYFAGFNGYLILGYYLKHFNFMGWRKTLMLAIPMFAAGYFVSLTGYRSMASIPDATEEMLELFWTFCSPNVMLMTIACFIVLQKVRLSDGWCKRSIRSIGKYGLGIFMCHYFFVGVAYQLTQELGLPIGLQIPVSAVIVMSCATLFTMTVFRLLPRGAKWIMG